MFKQKEPRSTTGPDNPYPDMYEMLNKMNKHGIIGSSRGNLRYHSQAEPDGAHRLDMSFEYRSQQRPYSMTKYPKGMFREQNVFSYESNTDFC